MQWVLHPWPILHPSSKLIENQASSFPVILQTKKQTNWTETVIFLLEVTSWAQLIISGGDRNQNRFAIFSTSGSSCIIPVFILIPKHVLHLTFILVSSLWVAGS